ncbi:MAG TPA: MarR family transcriptional regulator [Candidatus Methanoperedenaceae archaeon]|nr:MarR family transcriptional regulator [Candidatus Methanoperedenaceae archaeon]
MGEFEKIFGRTAQQLVLENLIERRGETTYLSGISEETGLSHSSVARVIEPLVEQGIVLEKKLGKQIRTFRLNEEDMTAKLIIQFYSDLKKVSNNSDTSRS